MMEGEKRMALVMCFLLLGLVSNGVVSPVTARKLGGFTEEKNYYHHDPHHHSHSPPSTPSNCPTPSHDGTPPSYGGTPPSHDGTPPSFGGTPPSFGGTPPSHDGTPPSFGGTPPSFGGTPPTPPHAGGGYYNPPTPIITTPPSPPLLGPISPSPLVPITPPTPFLPIPTPPSTPTPFDPNSPPFFTGTCNFWRTHPAIIWGVLGYWGTIGRIFGPVASSPFGRTLSLPQALSNTRDDGFGALYREGTASLLNSLVNKRFAFTTQQVRDAFMAAVGSEHSAMAQAQLFRKANEGRIKHQ